MIVLQNQNPKKGIFYEIEIETNYFTKSNLKERGCCVFGFEKQHFVFVDVHILMSLISVTHF